MEEKIKKSFKSITIIPLYALLGFIVGISLVYILGSVLYLLNLFPIEGEDILIYVYVLPIFGIGGIVVGIIVGIIRSRK